MGQIIAVVSGKGGTGKTTICAGIAECLAAEGCRVLCIDTDFGLRNLDISLGMSDLAPLSFADILSGRYPLSAATPHSEIPNLFLLTAPVSGNEDSVSEEAFCEMLNEVRESFDYCLIDAPAGIGTFFRLATAGADRIFAIATSDPASMRDAACTADTLFSAGKTDVRLIVNRITPALYRRMKLTVDDVMDDVGLPLMGIVPEDSNVVLSAANHKPLILWTDRGAAAACLHLARRLRGIKVPLMKIR